MERVNLHLVDEIKKLGGFDLQACYSCGNCSAMCPLSEGEISFPRKMIRYSMLGLEGKILSAAEPWLCYYCGECSETCPREADPGGLMMALRRFTIRKYSIGKVSDIFYSAFTSGIAWVFLSVLVAAGILFLYNRDMNLEEVEYLSFLSLEHIHDAGLALGGFVALAFLTNIFIMARAMKKSLPKENFAVKKLAGATIGVAKEAFLQKRFRTCEGNKNRHIAHLALVWGFALMFIATLVVMGVDYEYISISRTVPFLFGSAGGILTLAGAIYYIYLRVTKKKESAKHSHHSDWIFLLLIVLAVLSGFVMDMFKSFNLPMAAYVAFAVHLVVVFDLLVSFPFTKFAHVAYRPIALWLSGVK